MKSPIKGATEKELVEMMLTDKPSKMIWNVAIEEAANKVKNNNKLMCSILKLKK